MFIPFLLLFFLFPILLSLTQKNRVILFGLDGLNSDCLQTSYAPHIFSLIKNGSYTFRAKSTLEAWSAPGWSSLLCSLPPIDTGIVDNSWIPTWLKEKKEGKKEKEEEGWFSSRSGSKQLPCIFEIMKKQNNKLKTGFYHDWDWLDYFGNEFMDQKFIDDQYYCENALDEKILECDVSIKEKFIERLKKVEDGNDHDFDFFFVYFNSIDFMGHNKSFCGEEYSKTITLIDGYIGEILNILKIKSIIDHTYIIVTSDHGAKPGSFNHGEQNDDNLFVPWIAVGPGIRKDHLIRSNFHLMDTAPNILKMMKLKKHYLWRGKVYKEIWEDEEKLFLDKWAYSE